MWRDIDEAFSQPVSPADDEADYVPTQIIAELFRAHGLNGIAYRSALGPGHNLALFDPSVVELTSCGLLETVGITFETQMAANPYFIKAVPPTR